MDVLLFVSHVCVISRSLGGRPEYCVRIEAARSSRTFSSISEAQS